MNPTDYRRSPLHGDDLVWVEKNCYVDVWIETIHALGLEPLAMLPFVIGIDFEGDQFTFYKPPHDELRALYGIDVQELTVWRPLIEHAVDHLAAGRMFSTETDAWWLPDTAGTDYRSNHVKTTIVITAIDPANEQLTYFHNTGLHQLSGEDFRRTFRLDDPGRGESGGGSGGDSAGNTSGAGNDARGEHLPLYAELVRSDRIVKRDPTELRSIARARLAVHLTNIPAINPLRRFGKTFEQDLGKVLERGPDYYHAWAFATLRQLGSAFELAALHLKWLGGDDESSIRAQHERIAIDAFESISVGTKTLLMKCARAAHTKRVFDAAPLIGAMTDAWDRGMLALERAEPAR